MDTTRTSNLSLRKKKALDNDEKRKKIIVGTITTVWYNKNAIMKEPSHDWELERRCFLNPLYNGRES